MVHWFNDTRIGNYVFGAHGSLSIFQRIRKRELLASTIYLPLSPIRHYSSKELPISGNFEPKSLNWKANLGWPRTGRRHSRADPVTQLGGPMRTGSKRSRPSRSRLWKHHASSGSHQSATRHSCISLKPLQPSLRLSSSVPSWRMMNSGWK